MVYTMSLCDTDVCKIVQHVGACAANTSWMSCYHSPCLGGRSLDISMGADNLNLKLWQIFLHVCEGIKYKRECEVGQDCLMLFYDYVLWIGCIFAIFSVTVRGTASTLQNLVTVW